MHILLYIYIPSDFQEALTERRMLCQVPGYITRMRLTCHACSEGQQRLWPFTFKYQRSVKCGCGYHVGGALNLYMYCMLHNYVSENSKLHFN